MPSNVIAMTDSSAIREEIFAVLDPLNATSRFEVLDHYDDGEYSVIDIKHRQAHVPDFQLAWSYYGVDNYLYRGYILPYHRNSEADRGEKVKISHSIVTIRSVSDAYGFITLLLFLDKHRPNNRS